MCIQPYIKLVLLWFFEYKDKKMFVFVDCLFVFYTILMWVLEKAGWSRTFSRFAMKSQ